MNRVTLNFYGPVAAVNVGSGCVTRAPGQSSESNSVDVSTLATVSHSTRAVGVNLLTNGEFDRTLAGWEPLGDVHPVDGKARFAPGASLSQTVDLPPGTRQVQVFFDVSAFYGGAQVSVVGSSLHIPSAGHFEPVFDVPDDAGSVTLRFATSPGAFDLDKVELCVLTGDACEPEDVVLNGTFDSTMADWAASNVTAAYGKARSGPGGSLSQLLPALKAGSAGQVEFTISSEYGGQGSVTLPGMATFSFSGPGRKRGSFKVGDGHEGRVSLHFALPACDIDDIRVLACRA